MDRVAGDLYNVALFVALWMTGLGLGLSSDIASFLAPLRSATLLTMLVVLDVVAIPLLVWALTHVFGVPSDSAIGLLLVGIASAGPLGITASRIAGGDARAAASFVIVLEAANMVAIPVWVALLLPAGVAVPFGQLIAALVVLVLAPLGVGVGLRAWRGRDVERWSAPLASGRHPHRPAQYFGPGDFGPGARSRPMIRRRAQCGFRSRYLAGRRSVTARMARRAAGGDAGQSCLGPRALLADRNVCAVECSPPSSRPPSAIGGCVWRSALRR